jgi:glycosyltransferase involved in cell wall biosynthesis
MADTKVALIKSHDPYTDPRLLKEIKTLTQHKIQVNMIYWKRKNNHSSILFENYTENKFKINAQGYKSILFWPIWWLYIFYSLIRVNYDIIHVLNYNSVIPALIVSKIKNTPIIYEIMDTSYDDREIPNFLRKIFVSFDKIFMKLSDAVILIDDNQIAEFGGIPNQNLHIIYDSAFDVSKKVKVKENSIFTLVFVGVLFKSRNLNLDKLCKAVNNLKSVKLKIAGYGDLVSEIEKISSQSHEKIEFLGQISYEDALKLSFESDALIVLRDSKPKINQYICGSKLLEAMMCSKPIIVNDKKTSTSEKVRKESCGILINGEDVDEIEKAIIELRDYPELRKKLGINGRKAYETKYSWELMEEKLLKLYADLKKV